MSANDVHGPFHIEAGDITSLNQVFSDAFTERYRRDGMAGVRVPTLNPAIWKFSLDDAAGGAMLWRDGAGAIAGFNVAHRSGTEGWMGPLAVRPDLQGRGVGATMVRAGIDWLKGEGARVIGLETMPRTVDNIGFYSSLGFSVGRMTVTFTIDAAADAAVDRIGRHGARDQDDLALECTALTSRVMPGYDFVREIRLTASLSLGDTVLLRERGEIVGFAVCHTAPLVEGRVREELRVLKVVLADACHTNALVRALASFARESSTSRAAIRVQTEYEEPYRQIVATGARVRWTDLRMTLAGFSDRRAEPGVVFSNWEI